MCILIYKPADKEITKSTFKNCFDSNRDGVGFAYVNTDYHGKRSIQVKKAMSFRKFWKQYKRAQQTSGDSDFLIHFRIQTHGEISESNNHPFWVNKNLVLGHNGIIHGMTKHIEGEENDTRAFIRTVLKHLKPGWQTNAGMVDVIEDYIGYSKLATLDINGNVVIFNETKGQWYQGVWYSNSTYKPKTYTTSYNNTRYKGSNKPAKVWLREEKRLEEYKNVIYDAAKGYYVSRPEYPAIKPKINKESSVFNVNNDADFELDSTDDLNIGDIVREMDDNGVDDKVCEYCLMSTSTTNSFKKYQVDGFTMNLCGVCAATLENDSIVNPTHLSGATIVN